MTQSNFNFLKVNVDQHGICTVMLSRPKARNAWTEPMRNEIVTALDNCSRDKSVRAVIITGDPEARAFCFGAQLPEAVGGGNVGDLFRQDSLADVPPGRQVTNATWRDGGGVAGLAVLRCTKVRQIMSVDDSRWARCLVGLMF
jgi:enoyl-CoA hydratase/carnithine racemase